MHILDIVRNSVEADAKDISVSMKIDVNHVLTISFEDNGRGMSPDMVKNVTDPFVTTRTTRKVGMGLSLIKMNAEFSVKDDEFSINSVDIWAMIKETRISQPKMMIYLKEMINNNLKENRFYDY